MMKATGTATKIDLKVFRHFMVHPSEDIYDGAAVNNNQNSYKNNNKIQITKAK